MNYLYKKWVFLAGCAILVLSCSRPSRPEIDFFKENVIIDIRGDRVHVTGKYFLRNQTAVSKRVTLYYPFPVDAQHSYPDIILFDRSFSRDSSGISFEMSIPGHAVDSFKILYQQKLAGRQCRYITTTTRQWRRPLKSAVFTVVAPVKQQLTMNYPVSGAEVVDDTAFYYIRFKDFYPSEDLRVNW